MPDFVNGHELSQQLADALQNAKTARLAVAFWGRGAADRLGIKDKSGVRMQVVCNLMTGGTNPHEIRTLLSRGVDVRQLNDLHAKLGVIDDLSFLGSSNMSTNGLGAEGAEAGWREGNVIYNNAKSEIVDMFESFWDNASKIEEADLISAAAAWAARRRGDAAAAAAIGRNTLVEVLRTAPEQLDALNVRMVVYDTMTDKDELAILNSADEHARQIYGEAFEAYWDWESMTTEAANAYLVDYDWPSRGRIARGALYHRDAKKFHDFTENDETFHVAYPVDTIEGIAFGASDKVAIRAAFHEYVRNGNVGEDDGQRTYNFPISELAPYLPPP